MQRTQNYGTATVAKTIVCAALASAPVHASTVNAFEKLLAKPSASRGVLGATTDQLARDNGPWQDSATTIAVAITDQLAGDEAPWVDRATTPREELIGELRSMRLLKADWDGEGAVRPDIQSIDAAVNFVRLLSESSLLPESMIHASGRAGLLWRDEGVYADLEFYPGKIVFYLERGATKLKGAIEFDNKSMPDLFPRLLHA